MSAAQQPRREPLAAALVLAILCISLPNPLRAEACRVGAWLDSGRTATCVTGGPGTVFRQEAFAYAPEPAGLAYVTFRLRFPPNIEIVGRPQLSDHVSGTVFTSFADGTEEWNFIVTGCPAGWVPIFGLDCRILDTEPALMEIRATGSLLRDCTFVLNGVVVQAEVRVNDPDCDPLPLRGTTWAGLKALYR